MEPRQTIGAFEIIGRLGAGGMGEVYRARDTVLGRDVALKILPADFASDPGRVERLAREARLLASLNHPNIAAIYAVETAGPIRALILELVDGETLGARLRRKPLQPAEARAIARQIVEALDAAHECGIVHRDLKPDNVMITTRGTVKVLDFGVAKNSAPAGADEAPTVTGAPTAPGAVIGTAAYMSPEQARGLPVDRRTDIWGFGCVLYEMLTGRRAFHGPTLSDTIVATLEKDPDWSALPRDTPAGLRRLMRRCLEKDPRNRLRDIADGVPDLDDATVPGGSRPPARVAWLPWSVAALAIVAAAWFGVWSARRPPSADPLLRSVLTPLTRDAGFSTAPALSRDGRLLAYASDRGGGGTLDIWVQQTVGGTPLRVTDDDAHDDEPDFSPDGSQVVFHSDRSDGGVYLVPALGGAARLVVPEGRGPKFSPDGARIAYWTGQWRGTPLSVRTALFVVSLTGGAPVRLASTFNVARAPVWAPDGHSLLFFGRSGDGPLAETLDWWLVKLDGSAPIRTGLFADPALRAVGRPPSAWTAEGVFFSDGRDLWMVPISPADGRMQAPPRRLTVSAGTYQAPSVSSDGRIVFASTSNRRVIERANLKDLSSADPPVQLYADFATVSGRPSETRDGGTIVFERTVSTGIEIWQMNLQTRRQQVVARVDGQALVSATISPDGSRIAYTTRRSTIGELGTGTGHVVETGRGVPAQICEGCSVFGFMSDSRRAIIAEGSRGVRFYDVVTGASTDVLKAEGIAIDRPHVSPDDHWLAFRAWATGAEGKSYVVPLTPGRPARRDEWMQIDEPTSTGRPCGWSLDAGMVYLLLDTDGFRCLWGQRIGSDGRLAGTPVPIRHFHETSAAALSTSFSNPFSPDGFLYATVRSSGNIWSLVRQP